jgi:hypothetical protein
VVKITSLIIGSGARPMDGKKVKTTSTSNVWCGAIGNTAEICFRSICDKRNVETYLPKGVNYGASIAGKLLPSCNAAFVIWCQKIAFMSQRPSLGVKSFVVSQFFGWVAKCFASASIN